MKSTKEYETWWKLSGKTLTRVVVEGQTKDYVKLANGRRLAKHSDWYDLCPTREQAIELAKANWNLKIAALEKQLVDERTALAAFLANEEQ